MVFRYFLDMLDQFFAKHLLLTPFEFALVFCVLFLTPALVAAVFFPVRRSLQRTSYFFLFVTGTGLIHVCALALLLFGISNMEEVISGGFYSAFIVGLSLAVVLNGIFLFWISAARANDVYGSPAFAWIGFIPLGLGVLWLVLKRGKRNSAANTGAVRRPADVFTNITAGILFLVYAFVFEGLTAMIVKEDERGDATSAIKRLLSVKDRLNLSARDMAKSLPAQQSATHFLTAIEAEGDTVRFFTTVKGGHQPLGHREEMRAASASCANEEWLDLFRRGATLEIHYSTMSGAFIAMWIFSAADCAS